MATFILVSLNISNKWQIACRYGNDYIFAMVTFSRDLGLNPKSKVGEVS